MDLENRKESQQEYYLLSAREVERVFETSTTQGLSSQEIEKRRERFGWNDVKRKEGTIFRAILRRAVNPLTVILFLAAAFSWFMGEPADAIMISVAILFDIFFGVSYESYSKYKIELLKKQVPRFSYALRGNRIQEIQARDLVPGDICLLRAGLRVPADIRLVKVRGLRVDESVMTGEPGDVEKSTGALTAQAVLADQRNMVFSGTLVTTGSGEGIVVATGEQTLLGRLTERVVAAGMQTTPLERRLQVLGGIIAGGIACASLLIFVGGLLRGETVSFMLRQALTLSVSAIPEDLTLILTLTLAIGARRLLGRGGVVRHLTAAETLGDTTVVCVDKTGTLTTGQVTLTAIEGMHTRWSIGPHESSKDSPQDLPIDTGLTRAAFVGAIAGMEFLSMGKDVSAVSGSSLDRALVSAAQRFLSLEQVRRDYPLLDTLAFNPSVRFRASLHASPTRPETSIFVVGAPDALLPRCVGASDGSKSVRLTSERRTRLELQAEHFAKEGKHVLAVAQKVASAATRAVVMDDIHHLTFLALLVFHDPLRTDAAVSVQTLLSAGIRVMLVSGDHRATAVTVAEEIGLLTGRGSVLTGVEVTGMTDARLADELRRTTVIARVDPLQKERIVRLLQERGGIVSMVGDGVNDAVALRRADLGVAVGSATDVAKDASDLVLVQEGIHTLAAAVHEGRRIRETVRTVLSFLFSTNLTEVLILLSALVLGLPLPFLPAMLLWVNIVTDGTADIALALEPTSTRRGDPRPGHRRGLFRRRDPWMILVGSLAMLVPTLLVYVWALSVASGDLPTARTVAFVALTASQIFVAFSYRSLDRFLHQLSPISNPWLLGSIVLSLGLLVAAVELPLLQRLLGTVSLSGTFWGAALGAAAVGALGAEGRKLLGKFFAPSALAGRGSSRPALTPRTSLS